MRNGKVLAGVLVLLIVAAGIVAYVERSTVIGWYQTAAQSVKGAKSGKGAKALYHCPMHPNFTSDRPGNCSICGMSLVKKTAAPTPTVASDAGTAGKKILYYRNPMDPTIHSPVPMKDQMGMDYVPVYEEQTPQAHTGVYISPEKQQLIGVRKGKVQVRKLSGRILTVGRVAYDPKLFVAQQEYLQALKGQRATQNTDLSYLSAQSQSLLDDMRYKLLLMGMSNAEVDELAKRGEPETNLYLPTPRDKQVWVYITIYEYEVGLVKEGMPVQVDTLAYPGATFQGRVVSITPLLEMATRTLKVRALVDNPEGKLKLEMFANVQIDYDLGEKLAVSENAVMHAGTRNIVFLADADGHFTPKTVTLGAKAQGYYEVLRGLTAGEEVVTSGNFLVDSESKLNAVLNQMEEPNPTMNQMAEPNPTNGSQHD